MIPLGELRDGMAAAAGGVYILAVMTVATIVACWLSFIPSLLWTFVPRRDS
jgi:hypothetical protein